VIVMNEQSESDTTRSECLTDGCTRSPSDSAGYCGTCLNYIDGTYLMTDGGQSEGDIERRGWTCTDCNLKKEGIDPDNCPNCGSGNIVVELGMENGTVRYVDTETEGGGGR
jgi:hypothetical protein